MASIINNAIANSGLLATQLEALATDVPEGVRSDEVGRRRLLDAMRKLTAELEPAGDTTKHLLYTPCELAVTKLGVDLDVYNTLVSAESPLTTAEIIAASPEKNADVALVARLLKYLASIHVIREVSAGVFTASNRTRNLAEPGVAAGAKHNYNDVAPAWFALSRWLKSKGFRPSGSTEDTAFCLAQGMPLFPWYEAHADSADNFNLFMTAHRTNAVFWRDVPGIMDELGFGDTPDGVRFVDVGGGIGHVCAALKEKLPDLAGRFVLQDKPSVVETALDTPGVERMGVDFFTEQPVKGADVYHFRSIFCDWPDGACRDILRQTHKAASRDSTILLDETVVPDKDAAKLEMQHDMVMLAVMNSEARTESRFRSLLDEEGFEIKKIVFSSAGHRQGLIIAKKK